MGTAEATLGALLSSSYDGLLIDVGLPDMDGYDLVRQIRARRVSDAPVVIATVSDRDDLPPGLAVHGWLAKPFARDDVRGVVDGLLAAD